MPDFKDIVLKAWSKPCSSNNLLDVWQHRVRWFRRFAKGWSANLEADIRKNKKELMEEYDILDIKSETVELSEEAKARLDFILRELNNYWILEETKARQRAREKYCRRG